MCIRDSYNTLEISMVATYLEVSREDAEVWIVNLIRNANIEAKIDSERGLIVITNQIPNIYDKVENLFLQTQKLIQISLQIMNKTRDLVPRTNILTNNIKRFYTKTQQRTPFYPFSNLEFTRAYHTRFIKI
eukprot:TRINITY_DN421_c0_g1_i16.p1 TRINITY_DN421_c0_g1~~TRINITY_DN421_c0_g1_i16.p1  ORF type:complete len:131 (+),score=37.90 TRINITY_DN421_c0_g1_i16:65-457(+)